MKSELIVDDDTFMRRLLLQTLKSTGAQIRQASSGDQALAELATQPADLMIIDVNMPGRDGLEVLQALRADAQHAAMPVIMLTAGGLADLRTKAVALGVAEFFTKPFAPSELAAKAKEVLAG